MQSHEVHKSGTAVLAFGLAYGAMRTQAAVGDRQFLRSMIPHHSGAVLMCQQASLSDPEIRALCRFGRLNLATEAYPAGPFDLIFCRNVLIYFDRGTQERVIDGLLDRLTPGGLLFLGHAETLAGYSTRAQSVLPTVYARAPVAPARGEG